MKNEIHNSPPHWMLKKSLRETSVADAINLRKSRNYETNLYARIYDLEKTLSKIISLSLAARDDVIHKEEALQRIRSAAAGAIRDE